MAEEPTYKFLPEDKCLTERQLFDYIDGKMPAAEMHSLEKHLLGCDLCSDALEGFEKIQHREKIAAFSPAHSSKILEKEKIKEQEIKEPEVKIIPLHSNRRYYAIAAGLILIVGITLFMKLSVSNDLESKKMAQVTAADSVAQPLRQETAKEKVKADSIDGFVNNILSDSESEDLRNNTGPSSSDNKKMPGDIEPETVRNGTLGQSDGVYYNSEDSNEAVEITNADVPVVFDRLAYEDATPPLTKATDESIVLKEEQSKVQVDSDAKNKKDVVMESQIDGADKTISTGKSSELRSVNTTTVAGGTNAPVSNGTFSAPASGNAQVSYDDQEVQKNSAQDSVSTQQDRYYPLKASDKNLDDSYNTGVKMLDSGKVAASLVFFDEVLKNPAHHYYEDAQWKKAEALIKLNRKPEAKVLLLDIEKKGKKYKQQATEKLKTL